MDDSVMLLGFFYGESGYIDLSLGDADLFQCLLELQFDLQFSPFDLFADGEDLRLMNLFLTALFTTTIEVIGDRNSADHFIFEPSETSVTDPVWDGFITIAIVVDTQIDFGIVDAVDGMNIGGLTGFKCVKVFEFAALLKAGLIECF